MKKGLLLRDQYSSAAIAALLFLVTSAIGDKVQAQEVSTATPVPETNSVGERLQEIERYNPTPLSQIDSEPLQQVNSVSELSDVQPTDWAFQALQSLTERYNCLLAYPDGTYGGNRAMTRYEFASGLNFCLERIQRIIEESASGIAIDDISQIQRLQEEFAAELATLRGRVDALEVRTAELEANQFSTTTILEGEAIFGLVGATSGENAEGEDIEDAVIFGHRTRLNFLTSFTGTDELLVRLQMGNIAPFSETIAPSAEGDLFFASDSDNAVELDALVYHFQPTEKLEVAIAGNAAAADDFASTVNPFFDGDGATGALSTFASRPSIYFLLDNAGLGFRYELTDAVELSLGYLATEAATPLPKNGLFNGPYGALAQILLKPSDRLHIGLTYVNSYNNEMGTGSSLANFRSFTEAELGQGVPIVSNAYGVEASWQVSENLAVGGWVSYTNATTLSTLGGTIDRGSLDIWNWAVHLALPDIGREGSLAGFLVGMEPKVTSSSVNIPGLDTEDTDTSLHLEAFYQFPVTENILITPGIIWITAPNHNTNNDDLAIGTIRTTFTF